MHKCAVCTVSADGPALLDAYASLGIVMGMFGSCIYAMVSLLGGNVM